MSQSGFAFQRVAIVNRGEPAMRLINAVREWNAEGRPALRVIAVYTAADRHATFVREADESVLIGPAEAGRRLRREPLPGLRRAGARAARLPGGRGLARLGVRLGEGRVRRAVRPARDHLHRPVGRGDAPARRQDRVQAAGGAGRRAARAVERRPGARPGRGPRGGRVDRLPAHGQGDRGRRRPRHPAGPRARGPRGGVRAGQLGGVEDGRGRDGLPGAGHPRRPACRGAGRRRRRAGTVWTLGVRDCSVQRRNQKVIEESASTALDAEQEKLLRGHAAELVRAAGYVNAGTVEFLYEPGQKLLSFLEVNTRLQVEHPVTEACTGTDIVKLQLHIAAGGTLARDRPGRAAGPRARHRGPAHRRGSRARFRARPRPDRAPGPAVRPWHQGRHRGGAGRRHPAAVRLDDRQGDRVGPGPRRGPGPARPARSGRPARSSRAARPARRSCSTCSTGPSSSAARSTRPGWTP